MRLMQRYEDFLFLQYPFYIFEVFWSIRCYRTQNRNKFFDILDRYSMSYGNKKGTSSDEDVPLCGRRESNPYASRHQILSLACLPISTRPLNVLSLWKGLQRYNLFFKRQQLLPYYPVLTSSGTIWPSEAGLLWPSWRLRGGIFRNWHDWQADMSPSAGLLP